MTEAITMNTNKLTHLVVVAVLLCAFFTTTGDALALSQCSSYITVQWGDTLSGIAALCGTTMDAIRAANPGLGWWLYAGQVLYIPSGYSPSSSYNPPVYLTPRTYVVQSGDTLKKIAAWAGTSVEEILAVNPQITNANWIYVGQVINLPTGNYDYVSPPSPRPLPCPKPFVDGYSSLRINYEYGMYIRNAPGGYVIASAVDNETLYYKASSVFVDENWKVWVEVKLYPPTKGYYTGWLLVRDQFGTYFTKPRIGS
jgi:LysM repeat protein